MIHVISGAPCSGKSTYAWGKAQPGQLVIDHDRMAQAMNASDGHDAAGNALKATLKARDAAIGEALKHPDEEAYIIDSSPSEERIAQYQEAGADMITLDPGMDECIARAERDNRPEGTIQRIRRWYEQHEKGAAMRLVKSIGEASVDGGSVKGYASTFDRDPDSYGDVVAKGAFLKTIERWKELGKPIPLLYGHNTNDPEYNIGAVKVFKEDERGLYIEADFDPENPKAQYVRKLVKEGRLFQFSFAYDTLDWGEVTLEDGRKANELRELDIYEISLVQIPANQHAEVVEIKSAKSGKRNSKADEADIREAIRLLQRVLGELEEEQTEPEGEAKSEEPSKANDEELNRKAKTLLDRINRLKEEI